MSNINLLFFSFLIVSFLSFFSFFFFIHLAASSSIINDRGNRVKDLTGLRAWSIPRVRYAFFNQPSSSAWWMAVNRSRDVLVPLCEDITNLDREEIVDQLSDELWFNVSANACLTYKLLGLSSRLLQLLQQLT